MTVFWRLSTTLLVEVLFKYNNIVYYECRFSVNPLNPNIKI